jgi:hypothetical protein
MDMNWNLDKLCEENLVWVKANFGERPKHQPLLGIIEELGELDEAVALKDVIDACADVMIFMADFCNAMGFSLQSMYELAKKRLHDVERPSRLAAVGHLAHAFLKNEQGIRGTPAELEGRMFKACESIILTVLGEARFHRFDLLEETHKTWKQVEQRVWRCQAVDFVSGAICGSGTVGGTARCAMHT